MKRILFVALIVVLIPAYCPAVVIPYSAGGTAYLWDTPEMNGILYEFDISGVINVDPFPELIVENGRIYQAFYDIPSFSFGFGDYSFTGNGDLKFTISDTFLNLNGSGDFESMEMFSEEPSGFSTHFLLPEKFSLPAFYDYVSPSLLPDGKALSFIHLEFDASSSPAPVPEPSTFVLLGLGLFGLVSFGRKKFKPLK